MPHFAPLVNTLPHFLTHSTHTAPYSCPGSLDTVRALSEVKVSGDSSYALLLRGINVGGRNRLSMPELRSLCERLGFGEPRTLLQSGNVVVSSRNGDAIAPTLSQAISSEFGLDVTVIVRSASEMSQIVADNPFEVAPEEYRLLHVVFADRVPESLEALDSLRGGEDELRVREREIYVRYAEGSARSRLNQRYLERILGVRVTARNWNTVCKLTELTLADRG